MAVSITVEHYGNYGKCVKLDNGLCELLVSVDLGPRVLYFALKDHENLFFNDTQDSISHSGADFDSMYYKGAAWHIYGGHRLWVSPEAMPETYYPDNTPVPYDIGENEVVLRCEKEIHNDRQYTITIQMQPDSAEVTLVHEIANCSQSVQRFAPWSLNVTDKGGAVIVPQADRPTDLLANRVLAVWPYSNMADERVLWGKDFITLQQKTPCDGPFKVGTNNEKGFAILVNKGQAMRFGFTMDLQAEYPDYGCSFETYTNELMLEVETLSPIQDVAPGESVVHTETWSLAALDAPVDVKNEADCARVAALFAK